MIKKITSIIALALLSTQIQAQETYFSDDFEDTDASLEKWQATDFDGDENIWAFSDMTGYEDNAAAAEFGSTALISQSWMGEEGNNDGISLDPDNLITSIAIDLTAASGNLVLKFDHGSIEEDDTDYVDDHFGVYLTTTNDANEIIAESLIFEKTFDAAGKNTEIIDISSYAGQTVYLSFRHFNSADNWLVAIDNIEVRDAEEGELSNEEFSLSSFNIFPNPVKDQINLSFETIGEYNVVLSDILGREVRNVKVSNLSNTSIDVSDLKSGNYILNVNSEDKSFSKKVIIK
ncbi:T9SS-dependent choice-of-anchor J family protein [Aureivirga sp. CE67]|uniref:T9SS-dependent choice-of-anchor J family protein n=1 Tax=Aureivirga sp. CE67 TaxID=1788983 RepID=UPI0018CAF0F8|nr:T9SS type A sorting domain-containing protein [Aureivirga sp. CE67]